MATRMSIQQVGLIVDLLYHNSLKVRYEQKSLRELARSCETTLASITTVRNTLIEKHILIKEGVLRNQYVYWHPGKSKPNPAMLRDLYKDLIREEKRVEKTRKAPGKVSLERALRTLVSLGYTGVIQRSTTHGYTVTIEQIDLTKITVEE